MNQLVHILKYKFIAFFKAGSRITIGSVVKELGSTFVYSGFAAGAFFFSENLISYLLVQSKIGLFLLHEFISTILFIFFLSINAGNIVVSFSTLYKSEEVYFLLTKPVNPAKIFLIKFLDNFFYSSSTLMMFMISILAGYAVYFQLNPATIIAIFIFQFIPFMISAASLGVIILLVFIKLASKIGTRPVFYIIAAGYLIVLFSFFKVISPVQLVADVMEYYPNVNQYFGHLVPGPIKYLPNHWLSETLYRISSGTGANIYGFFVYQNLFAVILFFSALFLGSRWYHKTWLLVLDFKNQKKRKTFVHLKLLSFEKGKILSNVFDSVFKKDLFTFFREPAQIIHLSILLFLIFIFLFSLKGLYIQGIYNTYFKTITYLVIQLFNLLLITTLSLRFVFPLVSLEGKTFWKIKSAPVNKNVYMFIRLLPWFIIILLISEILGIFTVRNFSKELVLFSAVITFFISTAIIVLNFGMGALYANFKEKNPIRIASSQGASLTFLLSVVFMLFVIIVQLVPLSRLFFLQARGVDAGSIQFYYMSILIMLASLIITGIFIVVAAHSLKKDF